MENFLPGKLRIGVLFGGQSSEHDVSLASARSVMAALDPAKYDVTPIGITRHGVWLASGDPMQTLRSGVESALSQLSSTNASEPKTKGHTDTDIVTLSPKGAESILSTNGDKPFDVIFPVLHGPYGEDGTIQGILEFAGMPYVSAGVLGSAVGMDKEAMKRIFISHNIPIVPYMYVLRAHWERDPIGVQRQVEGELQYPMFAKPANMGSSVGVTKIHGPEEFAAALDGAARYDRRLIVEQGVDARECECAVLGNDLPEASVVGEIVPGNEFYDFRAKYVDDNSDIVIPADLPPAISEEIRRLALAAFQAIDAAGMARVDFFVARDLSDVWLNEINTIPGFTRISMYPKLWEASGLSYPDLLDRLIQLAIERHSERVRNKIALQEVGDNLSV